MLFSLLPHGCLLASDIFQKCLYRYIPQKKNIQNIQPLPVLNVRMSTRSSKTHTAKKNYFCKSWTDMSRFWNSPVEGQLSAILEIFSSIIQIILDRH